MSAKNRLVFDHIPKTAGQSISASLSRAFKADGSLAQISNSHRQVMLAAGERRFIAGHLWFLPGESLMDQWFYCTLLRDPVDRFLSQYWFNRSDQWHDANPGGDIRFKDAQVLAARNCSLEEYLKLDFQNIKRSYTNVQAAHFAQRKYSFPYDLTDSMLFDAAVSSLEEYDLVGIFEDIPGFLDVICHEFNLAAATLPSLNVTEKPRGKTNVDPASIDYLHKVNQVDLKLYGWAKQHFSSWNPRARVVAREDDAETMGVRMEPQTGTEVISGKNEVLVSSEFGTKEIEIAKVACAGEASATPVVLSGEKLRITVDCRARMTESELTIGIAIRGKDGVLIYGTNSRLLDVPISVTEHGTFSIDFVLENPLGVGEYTVTVALHKGVDHLEGCYHWIDNATSFAVVGHKNNCFEGIVNLEMQINLQS